MSKSTTIDKFDVAILQRLQSDARLPWVDMAEQVNLSASACQRRVKALQNAGIITGYSANISAMKVGYDVEAFVAVSVERQNYDLAQQFRDAIVQRPEVLGCYLLSGSIDFMLHVVAPDLKSFGAFIQREILSLPGVKDATSSIVLEQIKRAGPAPILS